MGSMVKPAIIGGHFPQILDSNSAKNRNEGVLPQFADTASLVLC
jgi:hypothetical protein